MSSVIRTAFVRRGSGVSSWATMPRRRKVGFNEEHYRQLLQRSGAALIVSHGLEEQVEIVNDTFTRLFGYTTEDIPDVAHWWPLAYPDEAYREAVKAEWQTRVARAIADQSAIESMEAKVRCKDGSERYIEFHFSSVGDTNLVSFIDLTERKQAEEAMRVSEERLRLAQWAAHVGTFDLNLRTGVDVWQPETEALYGLPPGGFGGTLTAFEDLIHPNDRQKIKELSREMMRTGQPAEAQWRVVWPDGSVHWIAGRGQVSMNESGEPVRMLGVNMDVTERKRADETLSQMTRKLVEAQEQERARIGRELHDDINQRLGLLGIELGNLKDHPSEVISRVQELVERTSEIANDVQALSHELHASKLKYLGAVRGLKSWCKEFGQRRGLEIDFSSEVISVLPLDIGICLFRVLQEALHNAVKHSGTKRIEVQLKEDSNEVSLIIHDSGKGFDVTAAMQGHGLGLTSMKERVRLVNGAITIHSNGRDGTTIHASVPLSSSHNSQRATG